MPEFLSPSIQVVEVRQGVADVQGVSTSVGGFSGVAEKGPINSPQYITSLTRFSEVFGGAVSGSYLFEHVDAFFKNGGSACWVNRVAHYTDITDANTLAAVAAEATVQSAVGGETAGAVTSSLGSPYNLEPGDTLEVDIDAGGAATATFDAAAATEAGSGATYASLNGLTVQFEIDNDGDVQTVTFSAAAVDAATTAAEFNAQARKCRMVVNTGEVDIVSDSRGTASEVDIQGGTALTAIGHAIGSATGTGDVADIDAVTHAEAKAVVEGDVSGCTYTPASGAGTATITSDTTGSSSSVNVSGGTAAAKFGFAAGLNSGSDNAAADDTITFQASNEGAWGNDLRVTTAREDVVVGSLATALAAGAATQADLSSTNLVQVGDYITIADATNSIRVQITSINGRIVSFASATVAVGGISTTGSSVTRERFRVQASLGGTILATFSELAIDALQSRDYFVTRINNSPDTPLSVVDLAPAVPDARPANASGLALSGGSDGGAVTDLDNIGSAASLTGLNAFDSVDAINMLSVPGITTSAVQRALLDYATNRGDLIAIMTVPSGLTPAQANTYVTATANLVSSYGAIYYPWVKVIDVLSGVEELSPVDGFAQGCYARTDRTRNVAKAPAGITNGRIAGITGVERELAQAEYDLLYPNNINAVMALAGSGILLFGSRTLESGEFRQIPHRRLFMFIEESLSESSRFVLFEDNVAETRAAITRTYKSFLRNLRLAKMLKGASDDEAFFVICDERNNTESIINSGLLKARVGVALRRPVEFMQIDVEQDTRSQDA